jgi:UDP-2,3-diacylglucosamine pyrophosphatase LpxH
MAMHFRSIWISDTHLGGKNIQSRQLFEFLSNTESDYLYLVGDIIDLLQLGRKWYWPEINNRIVNLVIAKAKNGTKVFYLPGNHDAALRDYCGSTFNNIHIRSEAIHTTADGRNFLVLHGDKFDCVIQNSPWLAHVGGKLYEKLLGLNRRYNALRSFFGKEYFSISAYLKHKCKTAVNYIGDFEEHLTAEIRENRVDGIVCGHIHHASIKKMGKSLYSNSGDWVESCTALAESSNGTFGIIDWSDTALLPEQITEKEYEKNRYSDRCLAPTN